jgi:hypothetical protein
VKHFLIPALAATAVVVAPAFAPLANADDIPGFGPYIGQWGAHGEHLTVNADGSGQETYNGGFVTFQIDGVDGDTANGRITGGSTPTPLGRVGWPATLQLAGNGQVLKLYITDGDDFFPFCKIVNGGRVNNSHCGT